MTKNIFYNFLSKAGLYMYTSADKLYIDSFYQNAYKAYSETDFEFTLIRITSL